ncbi:peptidase M1-like protein [Pontibacter ummariensis]|uniref:Peptidase family M1 n=1 Tax=Pontibacter ummariensis TaxID=1610492 RepID=A0A239HY64_9BACT|nr:M1 family aminopeptidase [Pontibacter ummariensis]PRY10116.1 peptidase M1-like protein [Pontibacter ummariensis]SNS86211.1 Peptidase family M1 [Pontibacter ummariensis]
MRFWEIFRFEIAYRLRHASTWLYFLLFLAVALLMVDGILVQEAKGSGNTGGSIQVNAPFMIVFAMVFFSMIGMAATAAFFNDATLRDFQSRMHPLFFTAPIRKADYLGGRLLGAFVVNALLLLLMPVGLLLGLQLQELEPELLGPFRLGAFLQPYVVILLPNMFVTAAILSATAVLSRRALASYIGGLVLFMGSLITAETLVEQTALREVAALLEPFGFLAVRETIAYWTPVERNTQLVPLGEVLLWNRLLWITGALGVLVLLYRRFRFGHEAAQSRGRHKPEPQPELAPERVAPLAVPQVAQAFTGEARLRQVFAVAGRSFREIFANRYLLFLATASLLFLFLNGWDAWVVFDTPTWPVTYVVAKEVLGQLPPLVYFLLVVFAGELVWMEREAGMSEITDALPLPNWVSFFGKFLALVLALVALQGVLMGGGMLLQALKGYYNFEPGLYVQILFGIQLADYLLWAALAMLVHVLVNQKYVGHLVFVLYYVFFSFGRRLLEIEHHMLLYPSAPAWTYSDMSGFTPFLAPYLWFKLYWGAWALLLLVVANLFWRRGREAGLLHRLREAGAGFTRRTAMLTGVAMLLLLATGGFVFYNTNVLHEYQPFDARVARLAAYERLYKRYEDLPQPHIAGSSYQVEIYPERPAISVRGTYLLRNSTPAAIDSIHLMIDPDIHVQEAGLGQEAGQVLADKEHGYYIFQLKKALAPGDSVFLFFDLLYDEQGFSNSGVSEALVGNGTLLDQRRLPVVGYQPDRELKSEALRREQGLAARAKTASVYDAKARARRPGYGEWVNYETIIGTSPDQVAVAPGSLKRTWQENGRRYFHYATDGPVKNIAVFLSARYQVLEDQWQGVQVQVLHHPEHAFNLNSMVRGVKASLDYYTKHFGPYLYPQLRIVEFPRHQGSYARAFPGTVAYSEGLGFLARVEDGIDYPFVVTAHEVAHQWWGGQFVAADVQGRRVLHETLAHYSALMVMEKAYGPAKVRQFLGQFRHRYLVGRQNRGHLEVPLLLSEDQDYIHYDKGAVVMYALRDYLGEEAVNRALRHFLEKHRYGGAPYPTSRDLLQELQAVTPDSLQYLLTDLFEEITLWDMRTKQVQAVPLRTGGYRVTLQVEANKMKADSIGRARQAPMDDLVEIGAFAAAGEGEERGKALYLQKHRIRSGSQAVTVTVPVLPARAGIDPYHKLIEWTRDDNVVEVAAGVGAEKPRKPW